jgi:DNA-binding MarR family transcriptional regulator
MSLSADNKDTEAAGNAPWDAPGQSRAQRFFLSYRRVARGIGRRVEARIMDKFGLDLKEFAILRAIHSDIRYPTDLAGHLDLSKDMTSRAVQKLLRSELLERRIDVEDSRRTRLNLTPAGLETLAETNRELDSAIDALLAGMQPEHAGQLLQHMDTLANLLADDHDAEAAAQRDGADQEPELD